LLRGGTTLVQHTHILPATRDVSITEARLYIFILETENGRGKILKQSNEKGFPKGGHLKTILKTNKLPIPHKHVKESIENGAISPLNVTYCLYSRLNTSL